MNNHRSEFPISLMCEVLKVSRSGYYAWLRHPESTSKQDDKVLLQEIHAIYQESHSTYGSPRIYRELKRRGRNHGKKRIARLMSGLPPPKSGLLYKLGLGYNKKRY